MLSATVSVLFLLHTCKWISNLVLFFATPFRSVLCSFLRLFFYFLSMTSQLLSFFPEALCNIYVLLHLLSSLLNEKRAMNIGTPKKREKNPVL